MELTSTFGVCFFGQPTSHRWLPSYPALDDLLLATSPALLAQTTPAAARPDISLDSIRLSDPLILAD